ncbi:MAG: hypothetical protein HC780_18300 [Leptolyngbyaceae cyanobacterium CSU_1_3]|nr:hypothetical protein [Leptolyngbyaceae cyanobacterium CSU_1_3]
MTASLSFLAVLLVATGRSVHPPKTSSLSLLYVIPLLLAAWFTGERYGAAIAVLSASLWMGTELSHPSAVDSLAALLEHDHAAGHVSGD